VKNTSKKLYHKTGILFEVHKACTCSYCKGSLGYHAPSLKKWNSWWYIALPGRIYIRWHSPFFKEQPK